MIQNIIKTIRPLQWIKNLLIFAPLVFSLYLFDFARVLITGLIFVLFCLLTGAVYIINDIIDRKRDILHPEKRLRPIASGALATRPALLVASLFLLIAFGGSYFIDWQASIIFFLYFILNIFYSFYLKRVVILDATVISIGFILRIYAGAVLFDIPVNSWILICIFLLSLFLFFAKRRLELNILGRDAKNHREIHQQYNITLLDQFTGILAISSFISYALWTLSPETIIKFNTNFLFYTTPFVFFGIFRFLYHINREIRIASPLNFIFKDKLILLDIFVWFVIIIFILYF